MVVPWREPTMKGSKAYAKFVVPVPPKAVEPEPVVREPEPKVMVELAKLALVRQPAQVRPRDATES